MRAAKARADQLAELRNYAIAHVHAVVVIDHVHAIDVDRQRAPAALRATDFLQRTADALFERRAGQQAGQGVVAVADDGCHAAGEQFGEPGVMRRELRLRFSAKQRQHAHRVAVGAQHRAYQHAVGTGDGAGRQHHAIDDGCLAPHLCHRQQMTVRLGQQRGVDRRLGGHLHQCDAFLGHDQRRQADLQMLGGTGDDGLEIPGALRLIVAAAGDRQQHLQIVVLLQQRAVQIQDFVARHQFAPQTFDAGLDQCLHE
jgi:hypothetical protein